MEGEEGDPLIEQVNIDIQIDDNNLPEDIL